MTMASRIRLGAINSTADLPCVAALRSMPTSLLPLPGLGCSVTGCSAFEAACDCGSVDMPSPFSVGTLALGIGTCWIGVQWVQWASRGQPTAPNARPVPLRDRY